MVPLGLMEVPSLGCDDTVGDSDMAMMVVLEMSDLGYNECKGLSEIISVVIIEQQGP